MIGIIFVATFDAAKNLSSPILFGYLTTNRAFS
jgi:hypothetical protein